MRRGIDKIIVTLMVLLMTVQCSVLWPPWAARQDETEESLKAVVPLPRAVGALPDAAEDVFCKVIYRCKKLEAYSDVKGRRCKVNMGYRIRDQTFA